MEPITLISGGSRGDVQPFILLGQALHEAGYSVRLALPPGYAAEVQTAGLAFHPLRADFDALLGGQAGQNLKTSGRNPLVVMREGQHLMRDIGRLLVEDAWELAQTTRGLIGHIGLSACTQAIASVRNLPVVHVALQPFMPTRAFPHPLLPVRQSLGGVYNRLTGNLVQRITWNVFAGETRRLLNQQGDAQATKWRDYAATLDKITILNAFSAAAIPFPADWKANNHITGFWLPPLAMEWQPAPALVDFLDAGEAPVFVGFGSVSDTTSVRLVLEALNSAGERGVLVGFDTRNEKLPATVFALPSVPYQWLFKHVKAAIHHGGAGTTAHALHAGLPMLAVPQVLDQFFWAERMFHAGAALKPIPYKQLTAAKLAAAVRALVADDALRARAATLGERVQAENGLAQAVKISAAGLGIR